MDTSDPDIRFDSDGVCHHWHEFQERAGKELYHGDDGLRRAREMTRGRMLLRMEDTRAVAAWAGAQEMLHDRVLTVENVVQRVDAITTDDVNEVANRYLLPERQSLAVVGPFRGDRQFQNLLKV